MEALLKALLDGQHRIVRLYVTGDGLYRVQVFDRSGQLLLDREGATIEKALAECVLSLVNDGCAIYKVHPQQTHDHPKPGQAGL